MTNASKPVAKRLNLFERYLSLWAGACMIAGILLGRLFPEIADALRRMEFGSGSHINIPIAVLIWLMIIPMTMKVDFASIRQVGQKPRCLLVTLFVNWLVKPFSMAFTPGYPFAFYSRLGYCQRMRSNTSRDALYSPPRLAPQWYSCGAI